MSPLHFEERLWRLFVDLYYQNSMQKSEFSLWSHPTIEADIENESFTESFFNWNIVIVKLAVTLSYAVDIFLFSSRTE